MAGWWAARYPHSRILLASRSGRAEQRGAAALQLQALCSAAAVITVTSCDVSSSVEVATLDHTVRQLSPGPITVRTR